VKRFTPHWLPKDYGLVETLLLFQAIVAGFFLLFVLEGFFEPSQLPAVIDGKPEKALLITWCFAAIAGPVGIFKIKSWGYFCELIGAAPFGLAVLYLSSRPESPDTMVFFHQFKFAAVGIAMLVMGGRCVSTGFRLFRIERRGARSLTTSRPST